MCLYEFPEGFPDYITLMLLKLNSQLSQRFFKSKVHPERLRRRVNDSTNGPTTDIMTVHLGPKQNVF